MDAEIITTLWRFVRGDMLVADFEAWLYARDGLEVALGEKLHFEMVSFDYRDDRELSAFRKHLAAVLRPRLTCECITLPDLAVVPMGCDGLDERVFATLEMVCDHGAPLWWLHLSRCAACGQNWMIAQEERIFDDHFLRRLEPSMAEQIAAGGAWPAEFITYERVLTIGGRLSRPCCFLDPLSPSLIETANDLRKERSTISVDEIARLIGVDPTDADRFLSA